MSLVRLLTAGKSLVGGANDSASRYRMANPAAMPKFHASKNPFRAADGSNVKAEISTAKEVGGGVECQVPSVTCQVSEVARQAPTGSGGRSPVGRSLGRLQRVIWWSCGLVVLWAHVLGALWARRFGAGGWLAVSARCGPVCDPGAPRRWRRNLPRLRCNRSCRWIA